VGSTSSRVRRRGATSGQTPKVGAKRAGSRTGRSRAVSESDSHGALPARSGRESRRSGGSGRTRREQKHESGGGRFRRGMPMGAKIALFTVALVALLMSLVGLFLYQISANALDVQINQRGVVAAKEMASFADPMFWFNPYGEEFETAWKGRRQDRIEEWQEKFDDLVRDDQQKFVFVGLVNKSDNRPVVAASADGSNLPPQVTFAKIGSFGEVDVYEGTHQGIRVRRFISPVHVRPPKLEEEEGTPRGDPQYKADVFMIMQADDVDKVQSATMTKIVIATVVGVLVAVFLSIGVSMFLVGPLRTLVNDMRIVARGNLDHKTQPRSADEIGYAAHQFNEMTKSLRQAQHLREERAAIENELSIATDIQTKLLPDRIPQIAGFDIFSYYLSAREVGGDYYDFLVIDQDHLGVVVADVSGKGIPGAMVMTMVRSLLRMASQREMSPKETLKKVNRILAKDIRRGMFVTAVYGVLEVSTRTFRLCSAGHNPVLFMSAKSKKIRQIKPNGIALGFDKGRTFDDNITEEVVQLEPGDRMVIYTDGVVEAMDASKEEFGIEKLAQVVHKTAGDTSRACTHEIVSAIESHRGSAEQSDDITIVTLGVT
jgi:serine phosphatase RsbU (regulator of sigma subunit)